jgi:hypothetical protein
MVVDVLSGEWPPPATLMWRVQIYEIVYKVALAGHQWLRLVARLGQHSVWTLLTDLKSVNLLMIRFRSLESVIIHLVSY